MLDKYKELTIPAKVSLWFVACNILQKGISTITVPIFTRILTTEQYGLYNVYLSWLSIITIFTSLNLYYGVFNNAMMKYEGDRDRYVSSMQGLTSMITGAFFIVYLLFSNFWNAVLEMPTVIVMLMFAELLVTPALQFWSARQRFEYKYKTLVSITLLMSIVNPIIGIFAVLSTENKAEARIISVVIVDVLICGSIMAYQFFKGRKFYVKKYWKYAALFNLPLLPHYLSGSILNQADRIMISKFVGPSAAGIYSVAYNIGMLMQLFTSAINSSFTPWLYKSINEEKYSEIKKTFNLLLILMAGMIICLMFFAPEIVHIFASSEYYAAIYVIPPVAASVFFIFMYNIFANIEFYFEKNKFIMIASIFAAVMNVVLNWIFIPIFGYFVAGYTTLVCYIIYSGTHYAFSLVVCKKHMNGQSVYDTKAIVAISLFVIGCSIFLNFLYNYSFIRYGLAAALVLVAVLKRNVIISRLKAMLG